MNKVMNCLLFAIVVLLVFGSCARKPETTAQVKELVPGLKRLSGPFKRISDLETEAAKALGNPDVTVTVDASTSKFTPDRITVKQNQVVKLILKGTDDGDLPKITALREFSGHGFHVFGPYDIWVTGLRANVVKEIIFKATVAGEFEFECPVFCSVDHYKMRGKLIVEPI
ncbi:MAG: cupredoxin domain-containing protein [Spirochaetota bacterium]